MSRSRLLGIAVLALMLGGCSWIGGEPSEAELAAERLRQPPDVLSSAQQDERAAPDTATPSDGVTTEPSRTVDPASLLGMVDGEPVLDLGLPLEAGWAIVGRALDRSGFALLDSDREGNRHRIRYDSGVAGEVSADAGEDKGFLSALTFWRDEPAVGLAEYEVIITERGKGTRVRVETVEQVPAPRGAAQQVLAVLAEQLKP